MDWKVNGNDAGKGLIAYRAVLQHLESMNNGCVVTICYPGDLWHEGVDGYVLHDILPFRLRDDLRKEFQDLILRKDIGIKHKPY